MTAAARELDKQRSVDQVYAFWSANLDGFAAVARTSAGQALVEVLQERIKSRLHELVQTAQGSDEPTQVAAARSAYLLPKEKRVADHAGFGAAVVGLRA